MMSSPFHRPLTTVTCMIPIGTKVKWLQPAAIPGAPAISREGEVDAYVTTHIQKDKELEIVWSYRVAVEFPEYRMYMYPGLDTEFEVVNGG